MITVTTVKVVLTGDLRDSAYLRVHRAFSNNYHWNSILSHKRQGRISYKYSEFL
jgi:hypothetical protein